MKSTLIGWFRKWVLKYPMQPLIYVCSHNGVTGAVRADDFDSEVLRMRKLFEKGRWPNAPVRPQVYPVFLFSNKTPGKQSFRVGTLDDLATITQNCAVEFRDFELPPLNAPGYAASGYFGQHEKVECANGRYRVWTLEEARVHLTGDIYSLSYHAAF